MATYPLYVQLVQEVDMAWRSTGECRNREGHLREAWTVVHKETIRYGDSEYKGSELIAMALQFCSICPAQWDCTRFIIETSPNDYYIWGTWGADMRDVRWLKRQGDFGISIVERARDEDVPVQVAVKAARRALKHAV